MNKSGSLSDTQSQISDEFAHCPNPPTLSSWKISNVTENSETIEAEEEIIVESFELDTEFDFNDAWN